MRKKHTATEGGGKKQGERGGNDLLHKTEKCCCKKGALVYGKRGNPIFAPDWGGREEKGGKVFH